jgi:hypothetical protein
MEKWIEDNRINYEIPETLEEALALGGEDMGIVDGGEIDPHLRTNGTTKVVMPIRDSDTVVRIAYYRDGRYEYASAHPLAGLLALAIRQNRISIRDLI